MNVALTSGPAAMSSVSEGNAPEETETIHPAEPMGGRLEGNVITAASGPPETVPQLLGKAQKAASLQAKKPNGSAYGAGVYAALARHKPRAVERGSTTVTFQIGGSGVLSNVRVGQSSGNARLDQMALQMVRDAAPFPPPPSGASFYTIQIDFQ
jgi:protein TonB